MHSASAGTAFASISHLCLPMLLLLLLPGIFTWCLVSVLLELFGPMNASGGRRVSYQCLIDRIRTRVKDLKWK